MKNKLALSLLLIIAASMPAVAQQQFSHSQQISTQQSAETEKMSSVSASSESSSTSSGKTTQKLSDVKRIFIASLGTGRGAELIRQRVINELTKSGNIEVVDSPSDADATFNGIARLHRYLLYDDFVTSGEAVVRLTGKNKQILWTDDINLSKFPGYGSANKMSTNIADKLVASLTKAIEVDHK